MRAKPLRALFLWVHIYTELALRELQSDGSILRGELHCFKYGELRARDETSQTTRDKDTALSEESVCCHIPVSLTAQTHACCTPSQASVQIAFVASACFLL